MKKSSLNAFLPTVDFYLWISAIHLMYRWLFCLVKNLPASAGDVRDMGSIPGLGRSPGGGWGNLLHYSCLENSMDRGAWWSIVHGAAKSQTRLSTHTFLYFWFWWDHQSSHFCFFYPDHLAKNIIPRVVLIFKSPIKYPYSSLRLSWNLLDVSSLGCPLNTDRHKKSSFRI